MLKGRASDGWRGGGGWEVMEGLIVELRARFRRYGTNGTVQERARSHAQQDYCFPLQFPPSRS